MPSAPRTGDGASARGTRACPRSEPVRPARPASSEDRTQPAGFDFEDDAVDGDVLDPRVLPDPPDLRPQVLVEIAERVEGKVDVLAGSLDKLAWTSASWNVSIPQPVCSMTITSSVPRSCWLITSDRRASSVASPPALRMMCASPVRRPRTSSTVSRASMHASTASLRPGGRGRVDRSNCAAYRSFSARTRANSEDGAWTAMGRVLRRATWGRVDGGAAGPYRDVAPTPLVDPAAVGRARGAGTEPARYTCSSPAGSGHA